MGVIYKTMSCKNHQLAVTIVALICFHYASTFGYTGYGTIRYVVQQLCAPKAKLNAKVSVKTVCYSIQTLQPLNIHTIVIMYTCISNKRLEFIEKECQLH